MTVLDALLILVAVVLVVPCVLLAIQCVAALTAKRLPCIADPSHRPSVAVLIPAHNEDAGIAETIGALVGELGPRDRLVVVADNCTDQTAATARDAGAEVIERTNADRRGKGFALGYGVGHVWQNPCDVLLILDADCRLGSGSLQRLAREAAGSGRPVQAMYLMKPPPQPTPMDLVSTLAFTVRNEVRPLGQTMLGGACQLMGTGMALPWSLVQRISWETDDIVEDMGLGLQTAVLGYPPRFCPEARVYSWLPAGSKAAKTQRTRWEHGHLHTLLNQMPSVLLAAVRRRNWPLAAMGLDLCIPPLSLLVILVAGLAIVTAALTGLVGASWTPVLILLAGLAVVASAVLLAWWRFARTDIPLRGLLASPLYLAWKAPIYISFIWRRQKQWIRTAR